MTQRVVYLLFLVFTLVALGSCTNDETDENLEVLTPNDPVETTGSAAHLQVGEVLHPGEK